VLPLICAYIVVKIIPTTAAFVKDTLAFVLPACKGRVSKGKIEEDAMAKKN